MNLGIETKLLVAHFLKRLRFSFLNLIHLVWVQHDSVMAINTSNQRLSVFFEVCFISFFFLLISTIG